MSVDHKTAWRCDFCDALVERIEANYEVGMTVVDFSRPFGWEWVGHKLCCPRHEVVVRTRKTPYTSECVVMKGMSEAEIELRSVQDQ